MNDDFADVIALHNRTYTRPKALMAVFISPLIIASTVAIVIVGAVIVWFQDA